PHYCQVSVTRPPASSVTRLYSSSPFRLPTLRDSVSPLPSLACTGKRPGSPTSRTETWRTTGEFSIVSVPPPVSGPPVPGPSFHTKRVPSYSVNAPSAPL